MTEQPLLVIGGAGFIGTNLVQMREQCCLPTLVLDRLPLTLQSRHTQYLEGDASRVDVVIDALDRSEADLVIHLAANSDIQKGQRDPTVDYRDTLGTTVALMQAAATSAVKHVIFASSSAVFGNLSEPIDMQSLAEARPESSYGYCKLMSEMLIAGGVHHGYINSALVARFPNVVGPHATHGVVFDFINRLERDASTLDVLGDGKQTKPYLHVDTLLGTLNAAAARSKNPVETVGIGPTDNLQVSDIVELVSKEMKVTPKVNFQESKTGWPGDIPTYSFGQTALQSLGLSINTTSRYEVLRAIRDLLSMRDA